MKSGAIRKMTVVATLSAVSIVMGLTPIGFIPIGPTRATIMHIPVILAAIVEGPVVGAAVGLIFGGFSLYQALVMPTSPISVLFLNPLVSILPRLLIGPVAYFVFAALKKKDSIAGFKVPAFLPAAAASVAGTLTNTIGVLGMLALIYAQKYVELLGITDRAGAAVIWGIALTNGLPEAVVSTLIITPAERAVSRLRRRS